ncbi:MAG: hypothetical protein GSR72_05155 [Desulfurococcales archaeon]|nr:hypothetical protein [Desulfurococcales archaeon]
MTTLTPPDIYMKEFYLARKSLVEKMLSNTKNIEEVFKFAGPLLSPMVATYGPAGINVAPFMLTFTVNKKYLNQAVEYLRNLNNELWSKGHIVYAAAAKFLLEWIYNPERSDPLTLSTHLMIKGHTYTNIKATGEAAIGILIPPDRGALELRAEAEIYEEGPYYEFVNLLHDLMHAVPRGERSHPWYPALILRVKEIYDNSYQSLGKKIYP